MKMSWSNELTGVQDPVSGLGTLDECPSLYYVLFQHSKSLKQRSFLGNLATPKNKLKFLKYFGLP